MSNPYAAVGKARRSTRLVAREPAITVQRSVGHAVVFRPGKGIDDFVSRISTATPMELVETERQGVLGIFVKDLSKAMDIPAVRMFDILGVPKATAEKKVAAGELIKGNGGRAALGLARLLGIAGNIVANSKSPQAKGFDSARWLGQWIERPQPALGGRKPADLIDTATGVEVVARLLGSIESGAYQ
jgi:putative toxin-antitoxin system antitoxin component (TIGR02293 family)